MLSWVWLPVAEDSGVLRSPDGEAGLSLHGPARSVRLTNHSLSCWQTIGQPENVSEKKLLYLSKNTVFIRNKHHSSNITVPEYRRVPQGTAETGSPQVYL